MASPQIPDTNPLTEVGLCVIDMQYDFIKPGPLGAHQSSVDCIEPVKKIMESRPWGKIIASRDWHPANHCSFAVNYKDGTTNPFTEVRIEENGTDQVLWPAHCIQGSEGALFHEALPYNLVNTVIDKGTKPLVESYSAWGTINKKNPEFSEQTGMEDYVERSCLKTLVFVGLCYDYCVGYGALDAAEKGYRVVICEECTGYVTDESKAAMKKNLKKAGVILIPTLQETLAYIDHL